MPEKRVPKRKYARHLNLNHPALSALEAHALEHAEHELTCPQCHMRLMMLHARQLKLSAGMAVLHGATKQEMATVLVELIVME